MCCGCVLLHQTHSPHPNLCRSLLHPTQGKGSCPGDRDSPRKTHSPGRRGERMALSAAMRAQVSWPGGYGDRGPFTPGPDRVPQDPHQPCPRPGALIEACWALSGNEISCFPGCPAHVSPASWHSTLIHRGPGLGSRVGRLSAPEIHLQEPCLRMDSRHRPDPRLCNPCPLGTKVAQAWRVAVRLMCVRSPSAPLLGLPSGYLRAGSLSRGLAHEATLLLREKALRFHPERPVHLQPFPSPSGWGRVRKRVAGIQ